MILLGHCISVDTDLVNSEELRLKHIIRFRVLEVSSRDSVHEVPQILPDGECLAVYFYTLEV